MIIPQGYDMTIETADRCRWKVVGWADNQDRELRMVPLVILIGKGAGPAEVLNQSYRVVV